jgi:hypothetical protein
MIDLSNLFSGSAQRVEARQDKRAYPSLRLEPPRESSREVAAECFGVGRPLPPTPT